MLKIQKDPVPEFWKKVAGKFKNYDDLDKSEDGREARQKLREHLLNNQNGICAYCCNSVDMNNSLNEHIKPKAHYPQNSLDYDNLILSCTNSRSCGSAKANKYDDRFVSPLSDDLDDHFGFALDGSIVCLTERAKYTCELLNLNSYKLKNNRAAVLKECKDYGSSDMVLKYYLYLKDGCYRAFADMILYYCEHPEIQ